jgi:hypothetical protein
MARIYKVIVYGCNTDNAIIPRRFEHAEYNDAVRTFSEQINQLISQGYHSYEPIDGYHDDKRCKLEKYGNDRTVSLWSEEQS